MKNILFKYNGIEYITLSDIIYRSESLIPTSYLGESELRGLTMTVDRYAEILDVSNVGSIAYPRLQVTFISDGKKYRADTWDKVSMFHEVFGESPKPEPAPVAEPEPEPTPVEEESEPVVEDWVQDLEDAAEVQSDEHSDSPLQISGSPMPKWLQDLSGAAEVENEPEPVAVEEEPEEVVEEEPETEVEEEPETEPEEEEPEVVKEHYSVNPLFLKHIDSYSLEPIDFDLVKDDAYCQSHGWTDIDSVWIIDDVMCAVRLIHSDTMHIHQKISYSEVARYNARH